MIGDNDQAGPFVEKDKSEQFEDRIIRKWDFCSKTQVSCQNFSDIHSFPSLHGDHPSQDSRLQEGKIINPVCNISRTGFKTSTENAQYSAETSIIDDIGSGISFHDPRTTLETPPEKFVNRESRKKHYQYARNTTMICLDDSIEFISKKYVAPRCESPERQQTPYGDVIDFEGPNITQLTPTDYVFEKECQSHTSLGHQSFKEDYLPIDASSLAFLAIHKSTFHSNISGKDNLPGKNFRVKSISNNSLDHTNNL